MISARKLQFLFLFKIKKINIQKYVEEWWKIFETEFIRTRIFCIFHTEMLFVRNFRKD